MAEKIIGERLDLQRLREKISLFRRDIQKFCEMISVNGQVNKATEFLDRYSAAANSLGRNPKAADLAKIADILASLRAEIANYLENIAKSEKIAAMTAKMSVT